MTYEPVWGRVYRGRVWHVLQVNGFKFCGASEVCHEYIDGLPPRGGLVCDRCLEAVTQLGLAVQEAQARQAALPLPTLDTGPPGD